MVARPKSRTANLVVQKAQGDTLIYDISAHKAFCLNETASRIWHLCDGKQSVAEISKQLSKQLKTSVSENLVMLAICQFNKDSLLESNKDLSIIDTLSRRELIKKAGFASAIALPIVTSLVAPKASMAAGSCIAAGLFVGCIPGASGVPCTAVFGSQCCSMTANIAVGITCPAGMTDCACAP